MNYVDAIVRAYFMTICDSKKLSLMQSLMLSCQFLFCLPLLVPPPLIIGLGGWFLASRGNPCHLSLPLLTVDVVVSSDVLSD